MIFFNPFKKKNESGSTIPFQLVPEPSAPLLEVVTNENNVVEETDTDDKQLLSVSCATGMPIDIIYGYLHKNYEDKGYNDALNNSNLAFRDMNMKIIRNKILMAFREVNLSYDVMKSDLKMRIESCNATGLLATSTELELQTSVINAHKEELARLEEDFRNESNKASVPLMSYECGFLRGVSDIAMERFSKTDAQRKPTIPTFNKQKTGGIGTANLNRKTS